AYHMTQLVIQSKCEIDRIPFTAAGFHREQVMADFSDIGVLSLGITLAKELGLDNMDVEDFIRCYSVTRNQILGE
ncbi:hypothetical protein KI387_008946, partial [Taxus chinensis]